MRGQGQWPEFAGLTAGHGIAGTTAWVQGGGTGKEKGVDVIEASDKLDIYSAAELLAAVRRGVERGGDVVIDLGGSPSIHAAALQILIAASLAQKVGRRALRLSRVSPEVARLLRLTGLDELLHSEEREVMGAGG